VPFFQRQVAVSPSGAQDTVSLWILAVGTAMALCVALWAAWDIYKMERRRRR
jgi:hypothetical protein